MTGQLRDAERAAAYTPHSQEPALLSPVASDERVELIDILRGFALLGILVVNFWGSSGQASSSFDRAVSEGLDIAVSSSFYPLFSFLFGLGFAVQLLRARERGAGVLRVYVRRLLALFLIGAFHAIVVWSGDILVNYALLGFLLVPLHRVRDRWLLPLALLPLVLNLWGPRMQALSWRIGGEAAAVQEALRAPTENQRNRIIGNISQRYELDSAATRTQAFTSSLEARWRNFAREVRQVMSRRSFFSDILAFFLLGFIVGRRAVLQNASRHRKALTWTAATSLTGVVIANVIIYFVEPKDRFANAVLWSTADYGVTLFYISGIALAVTFGSRIAGALRIFAAPGRAGLTNYLLQSVVMTMLFSRYGAGLDEPATSIWLALNFAFFFAVQVPLSKWWLTRFRYGPAEWVWRSMTYGALQPMRRA